MDRREPTMYAEKRHELEDMKAKLTDVLKNNLCPDLKFKHQIFWELGETKTLLLIFEKWVSMGRHGEAVNLVILFTEYQGYQGADLIVTHGYTDQLVEAGVQALKTLGFWKRTDKTENLPNLSLRGGPKGPTWQSASPYRSTIRNIFQ